MEYEQLIGEALACGRRYTRYGKTASYISELAKRDPSHLGLAICGLDGKTAAAGDCDEYFTMQSIAKLIGLILAIEQNGFDVVFSKVGMEPTGDAFNSMVRLDLLTGSKPFNPMINAGAIAVASCLRGATFEERVAACLAFARRLMRDPQIDVDYKAFAAERATGYKNRAIINLMKSNGIIDGEVEPHLDVYFALCSISANCRDLARFAAVLANNGCDPEDGERLVPLPVVQRVRSLMVTCGMYDYSGEFAATVGIPSKSGVGGGILSASIGRMGIAAFGPALDTHGTSVGGLKMIEFLSDRLGLNMF
jgi:glutaminase